MRWTGPVHHHRLHRQTGHGHWGVRGLLWRHLSPVLCPQVDLETLLTVKGGHAPVALVDLLLLLLLSTHPMMVLSQVRVSGSRGRGGSEQDRRLLIRGQEGVVRGDAMMIGRGSREIRWLHVHHGGMGCVHLA